MCISMFNTCSKPDQPLDEQSGEILKCAKIFSPGEVLNFTGKTIYNYEQLIGHNVLADMFCPNEVKITILKDRKIELLVTESGDCGERSFYAYGNITPSGFVTFEYAVPVITLPDGTGMNITDVIKGHLGGTIKGPGVERGTLVFFGRFLGNKLLATSYFIAKCEVEWPANNIFPTPVKGPIKCSWTYDLNIVK